VPFVSLCATLVRSDRTFSDLTLEMRAEARVGPYVKCLVSLSDFNPNWGVSTDFLIKYSNIKFLQNPFTGSAVVRYTQMGIHGEANRRIFAYFRCESAKKWNNTRKSTLTVHIFQMNSSAVSLKIILSSYLTENTLCL
jgi:hypothetical protein